MESFETLKTKRNFKKFLNSQLGTLYMELDDRTYPINMARHFDETIPADLTMDYFNLVLACNKWIETHPVLSNLVTTNNPESFGKDYIIRPFLVFINTTSKYDREENPLDVPNELIAIRSAFMESIGKNSDQFSTLIERILHRSIIDPNTKTFFSERTEKLVIVEPKITPDDLDEWIELNKT